MQRASPVKPRARARGSAVAEPTLVLLQTAADRWQPRLEDDGLDPTLATVLRLACDGLWMCDLYGLATPSAVRRGQVAVELERLARRA
jgi:hypothetical protein